jgi:ABC-type Zn uptake system ZnuABC Zn-binding protein ZnuA
MATTSIVGDIVRQVGGDNVNVEILLPLGTDPHSFTPTPQDITRLTNAQLVFINGAGLEEFLTATIESAGVEVRLVDLSASIPLRSLEASVTDEEYGNDPHIWMDPKNVSVWAQTIANALVDLDPEQRATYSQNASRLQGELEELDLWVREQVELIPVDRRKLVTDHLVFGYFADRYGFEQVGAVVPGFSTLSEPSAKEIAQLEEVINQLGVPALFVGWTANQNLAQRIADDTGIRIIPLFTHSLSDKGGDAYHYQDFIRYNVNAIVSGLR